MGSGHSRTVGKRTRSGSGHGWEVDKVGRGTRLGGGHGREADTVGRSGSGHGREADTVGRRTRSDGREADTVGRRKAARALRTGFTLGSFAACDRFVTGRLRPGRRSMCVGRGVAYVGGASMTMSGCSSACFLDIY